MTDVGDRPKSLLYSSAEKNICIIFYLALNSYPNSLLYLSELVPSLQIWMASESLV